MKSFITASPPRRPARLAVLFGALLAASTGAQAAGTLSGETISNTATLSYSVGGFSQTPVNSNTASFTVDNKVDVLVTGGSTVTTGVVAGATGITTTFTVTNEGNATQDFKLDIVSAISGDDFNPGSCAVTNVTGAGTYTAGDVHINALAPDSVATVTVSCSIPAGVSNGNDGLVALVATARANDAANTMGAALTETGAATAGVDIVFADSAGTDDTVITGDADGLRDAAHSDRNTYTVTTAVLSVQKTVATLCDPLNGTTNPKNIPGAVARWTITIQNSGTVSASLSTIADALNGSTTADPDLIDGTGGATACEYAAAGDGVPESANGRGVRIQTSASRAMAGTAAGASTSSYFTSAADADGVTLTGASLSVDFSTALPAGGTYTAGELKSGETITVYFNVGIN